MDAADDHYRKAAWVSAESLEDPAMDRTLDGREAKAGFEALHSRAAQALADVQRILTSGRAEDVVTIPWQGWSLRRRDFLLTRQVEIVVHADDLARSLHLPTPIFPDEVYLPVLYLLAELAVQRHGQADMTSALARRERMPMTISAF